uniref:J domain-containing protein n=2 Tax=Auxenochlorella protothecoides TaxID=3075 RepID=A0A1D2A9X5_AUXPR
MQREPSRRISQRKAGWGWRGAGAASPSEGASRPSTPRPSDVGAGDPEDPPYDPDGEGGPAGAQMDERLADMISWLAEVPEVVGLLDTRPLPESPTDPGSIALAPPVAPDVSTLLGLPDIEDTGLADGGGVPSPPLLIPSLVRQPRKRRAHVLRDGALTMVAYGADEILLWHKRVATFQQAMRAVLGDRRRTFLWSGSVLDSVIGAFLTQNVADHLSSSAFMIMAARFPPAADLARHDHSDSVDWEAVRCADKAQVADAIKGRGMQNFLAARIHDCLNHIRRVNWARSKGQDWASVGHISVKKEAQGPGPEPLSVAADQEGANAGTDPGKALPAGLPLDLEADADELEAEGIPRPEPIMTLTSTPVPDPWDETCPGMEAQELLSLEWVRDLPPKEAHDFLSSLHGLGRKSVACIVLLTLRNKEFPVDVNVGRIAARLGWIPLDSEDAVEALDDYAPEPEVHKYLHSRLVGFDVETLYELHYQMITLGKVFCNKLRPNCSACPLRDACEFALNGGPEKKVRRAAAQAAGLALAPPTPDKHREASARPQPAIRRASLAMPGELEASPPRPRPAHKLHWRQVQRLQRMQAEQDPERGAGLDAVLGSVKRGKRSRRGGAGGEPDGIVDLTPLGGLAEDLSMDAESLEPMILHSVPQGPLAGPPERLGDLDADDSDTPAPCVEKGQGAASVSMRDEISPTPQTKEDRRPAPVSLQDNVLPSPPSNAVHGVCSTLLQPAHALLEAVASQAALPKDEDEEPGGDLGPVKEDISQLARALLGLPEDSEPLARRQRYRQLSRHVHPDRCSHPDAHEVFSALQLALEVLQEEMVPAPDIAVGEQVGCGKEDAGPRFQSVAELGRSNDEALGGVRNPARLVLHCLAVPWGMLPPRLARYGSSQRREQLPLFLPEPCEVSAQGSRTAARMFEPEVLPPVAGAEGAASPVPVSHVDMEVDAHLENPMSLAAEQGLEVHAGVETDAVLTADTSLAADDSVDQVDRCAACLEEASDGASPGTILASKEAACSPATHCRGIVLLPASTALLGRFPLNGTYFQVNEVFADHSTVTNPVEIELCDLEGRDSVPVFIGHSIHHMAKGMAYEEVRSMFGRGHVCFRAWDSGTGNPEALPTWLLAGSGLKTKTKWKNSVERAADRAARLAALIEKHGPLAAAALGVQLTSPRARVPAPPRPKAPPQVRPERPGQRRRSFFPTIRSIQKCGVCAACLNPGWKKACLTRRAEMEALAQSILEADGAEEIQAGPGAEVDEGDADLAAEEEGEDLGLASEDKGEALEPLAEEEGKARDPVAMHPEDMIPA